MIRPELQDFATPINNLKPHPNNVRQGDIGAISQSLKQHGQYRPIVVQRSTGFILAGNHTYKAAISLKWKQIAATYVDCDDEQALRILLIDNRANDLASYDDSALVEMLKALMDTELKLEGTGFDPDDLDQLLKDLDMESGNAIEGDPDAVPDDAPSKTVLGDVWLLGGHRLMCGDSTIPTDFAKLMNGKKQDLIFTDPPYGVNYVAMRGGRKISNDATLIEAQDVMALALQMAGGETVFVCCNWKSMQPTINAMLDAKMEPKACIVWDKGSRVQNLDRYAKQHELIIYAGPYGGQPTADVDVWQIKRDFKPDHPTPKPVELIERALNSSSKKNDLVLDLFGGSGSTLIAAHQTGRTAYLMELDPHYCDVICKRFQQATGITPIAEATGNEHSFIE